MNIAFTASNKGLLEDVLFDQSFGRDNVLEPYSILKKTLEEQGHRVHTLDLFFANFWDVDVLIVFKIDFTLGMVIKVLRRFPEVKLIFIQTEEELISPFSSSEILTNEYYFDKTLSWRTDLLIKHNVIHQFYPNPSVKEKTELGLRSSQIVLIGANKKAGKGELYGFRWELFKELNATVEHCALAGPGWDVQELGEVRIDYLGVIEKKHDVLKKFNFGLVVENSAEYGGISEKIIDCLKAGTIPIYYGAPDIKEFIPEGCFIHVRDYENLSTLSLYIKGLSEFEVIGFQKEINKFLQSEAFEKFTSNHFVDTVLASLKLDFKKNKRKVYRYKSKLLIWAISNFQRTYNFKRFWWDLLTS